MTSRATGIGTTGGGFTLVELLVATGVFMLLGVLLVGLLAGGLEIWDRGEVQRDLHERAFTVFEMLGRDLRDVYIERSSLPYPAWVDSDSKLKAADRTAVMEVSSMFLTNLQHFCCGVDALGRPWLCFIKYGREDGKTISNIKDPRFPLGSIANDLTYVLYVVDPDPARLYLHRGVFPLTDTAPPQRGADTAVLSKDIIHKQCYAIANGVVYFGLRFWTQYTDTWDTAYPAKVRKNASEKIGPELRWDSTRRTDREFLFYELAPSPVGETPNCVLPEMVMVELTLRPEARREINVKLPDDIDASTKTIRVESTRGFPDAPSFVKIDNEWIAYDSLTSNAIGVKERGVRRTKADKHKKGALIVYGKEFRLILRLSPYREAR